MSASASTVNRPRRALLATALACLLGLTAAAAAPAPAAPGGASIGVYDSLATLRPDRSAPAGASSQASISAAQNEAESFQLLIKAGSGGLRGLNVEAATPLTGPGGAVLPASALTIYRQGYYKVTQRSDSEGDTGLWPDALIPKRDNLYGESRNAFPIDVPGGGQAAVWVDVLVPRSQLPGLYRGSLLVGSSSGAVGNVPLSVNVLPFSLPSTSTLKSAFLASSGQICSAFTGSSSCGRDSDKAWQLQALFAATGLNNRVTIARPYAGGPTSSRFGRYAAPLIQGTDPRVLLPGARLTSVEMWWRGCVVEGGQCLADWRKAASQYGFSDRFFLYNCDEPESRSSDWEQCKQTARLAEQQWPGVRKLVTSSIRNAETQGATSQINTLAPLINHIAYPGGGNQRSSYDNFLSGDSSRELWLYNSCRSHGCSGVPVDSRETVGWPGYAIDAPASQARAMGWMAFAYKATGELYYNTTQSLATATTNQYVSGGNGDGNLFYAGTPTGAHGSIAIGGAHDIPIESIRLKRLRDGREDYEYLHLLARQNRAGEAASIVQGLFGSTSTAAYNATVSGSSLSSARARLAAAIAPGAAPVLGPASGPGPRRPKLRVLRVRVPHSARRLQRRGVRALVRCTARCRVELRTDVSRRAARRLGFRSTRIAKASVRLGAHRKAWVTARLRPSARAKLRRSSAARVHVRARLRSRPV
jgi:hypothetical protein